MFDLRKIFDLSKIFAVPKNSLELKNYYILKRQCLSAKCFFYLALTEKRMQIKFDLKLSVCCLLIYLKRINIYLGNISLSKIWNHSLILSKIHHIFPPEFLIWSLIVYRHCHTIQNMMNTRTSQTICNSLRVKRLFL